MRTMIAKYPGTCFECGEKFPAGTSIKYYGRHHCEHAQCSGERVQSNEDDAAGLERGTLAGDRALARNGLSNAG